MPRFLLLALGVLLVCGAAATAHGSPPNTDVNQSPGHPGSSSPLNSMTFKGPAASPITSRACYDGASTVGDSGTGHIGHILGVTNLHATLPLEGITAGSVDLFHFDSSYGAQYANPRAIEGTGVKETGIMLGNDGYFRGAMDTPLTDGGGFDLRLTDTHTNPQYCIFGATGATGPWFFIGSAAGSSQTTEYDLNQFYDSLFAASNPGVTPTATHVIVIISTFIAPANPGTAVISGLDSGGSQVDVDGLTSCPGDIGVFKATFSSVPKNPATYTWTFDAGTPEQSSDTGATPSRYFLKQGSHWVDVDSYGANGQHFIAQRFYFAVRDCLPVAAMAQDFKVQRANLPFKLWDLSTDSDPTLCGPATPPTKFSVWHWQLDGADIEENQPQITRTFMEPGIHTFTLQVTDCDGGSSGQVSLAVQIIPNLPPQIRGLGNFAGIEGDRFTIPLSTIDPDGGSSFVTAPTLTLTKCGGAQLPAGATFPRGETPAPIGAVSSIGSVLTWNTTGLGAISTIICIHADDGESSAEGTLTIVLVRHTHDSDQDGIADSKDDCPAIADPGQEDANQNGAGDACDTSVTASTTTPAGIASGGAAGKTYPLGIDSDKDGLADPQDNCPQDPNTDQLDLDRDGIGDACDLDRDGDAVSNANDDCPYLFNPNQLDSDHDGKGDACSATAGRSDAAAGPGVAQTAACSGCAPSMRGQSSSAWALRAGTMWVVVALSLAALGGLVAAGWAIRRWK